VSRSQLDISHRSTHNSKNKEHTLLFNHVVYPFTVSPPQFTRFIRHQCSAIGADYRVMYCARSAVVFPLCKGTKFASENYSIFLGETFSRSTYERLYQRSFSPTFLHLPPFIAICPASGEPNATWAMPDCIPRSCAILRFSRWHPFKSSWEHHVGLRVRAFLEASSKSRQFFAEIPVRATRRSRFD
jgi:hypothetical protein